jgi:ubiquinone/menaquinone biosynthesis C-methylase UbiE
MGATPDPSIDHRQMYASGEVAARWAQTRARRAARFQQATEIVLDLAQVPPGARVLDVGAGTGDQTLDAARRVGPDGYVLATDISASMLDVAAASAREAGLTNVETRVIAAEQLDLPPDAFDVAISRMALMLIPDRVAALARIRHTLRTGGRLAVMVFAAPQQNPYFSVPLTIVARRGQAQKGVTEDPGMFALGDPDVLAKTFEEARFHAVTVQSVPYASRAETLEALVAELQENYPVLRQRLAQLSAEEQAATWAEISTAMGQYVTTEGVTVPGEVLVGVGTKNC